MLMKFVWLFHYNTAEIFCQYRIFYWIQKNHPHKRVGDFYGAGERT